MVAKVPFGMEKSTRSDSAAIGPSGGCFLGQQFELDGIVLNALMEDVDRLTILQRPCLMSVRERRHEALLLRGAVDDGVGQVRINSRNAYQIVTPWAQ